MSWDLRDFLPKKMTDADTDYRSDMEFSPLEPKFNALTLGYFISLPYLHEKRNRQRDIYLHCEVPCIALSSVQTVKRPKQLPMRLNRAEYSRVFVSNA